LNICKADEIHRKNIEVNIAYQNLEEVKLINDAEYTVGESEIRLPQKPLSSRSTSFPS
jgi:hypothetical protein